MSKIIQLEISLNLEVNTEGYWCFNPILSIYYTATLELSLTVFLASFLLC